MSSRPDSRDGLRAEPSAELARELDRFGAVTARAEFRETLRHHFVGGAAERPRRAAQPPSQVPAAARRQSWRWRLVGGSLAAAAALLVYIALFTTAYGGLRVNGELVARRVGPAELQRRLASAETIRTGSQPVRVRLGDAVLIEMEAESELDLTRARLASQAGPLILEGKAGRFRVATGPAFAGTVGKLSFHAPFARIEVTGTVFGVDIEAAGTCVCCTQGSVVVNCPLGLWGPHEVGCDKSGLAGDGGFENLTRMDPEHERGLRRLQTYAW